TPLMRDQNEVQELEALQAKALRLGDLHAASGAPFPHRKRMGWPVCGSARWRKEGRQPRRVARAPLARALSDSPAGGGARGVNHESIEACILAHCSMV